MCIHLSVCRRLLHTKVISAQDYPYPRPGMELALPGEENDGEKDNGEERKDKGNQVMEGNQGMERNQGIETNKVMERNQGTKRNQLLWLGGLSRIKPWLVSVAVVAFYWCQ